MRVVKVKESGNETASYTYDANGNKKSEEIVLRLKDAVVPKGKK